MLSQHYCVIILPALSLLPLSSFTTQVLDEVQAVKEEFAAKHQVDSSKEAKVS